MCPLPYPLAGPAGLHFTRHQCPREVEFRLMAGVLPMEGRGFVFAVEHPNHDSKEGRNDRHEKPCGVYPDAWAAVNVIDVPSNRVTMARVRG